MRLTPTKTKALLISLVTLFSLSLSGCIWIHSDKHEDVYHHDDDPHQVDNHQ
jgi:hypothetical protein